MKKACIMSLILVLTATLFAGCRNMNDTTPTTTKPLPSSSTRPSTAPAPAIPTPSGTDTTPNGTERPNRMVRPSARAPRY